MTSAVRTPVTPYLVVEAGWRSERSSEAPEHIERYWGGRIEGGADAFW
ncbi:MAG: hypothetical protein N2652_06155 [Kiritimatiellae bacterium]|nr:hypothetical protein [Kiritimatiellia bacterium]